jgi:hypothetical protein
MEEPPKVPTFSAGDHLPHPSRAIRCNYCSAAVFACGSGPCLGSVSPVAGAAAIHRFCDILHTLATCSNKYLALLHQHPFSERIETRRILQLPGVLLATIFLCAPSFHLFFLERDVVLSAARFGICRPLVSRPAFCLSCLSGSPIVCLSRSNRPCLRLGVTGFHWHLDAVV